MKIEWSSHFHPDGRRRSPPPSTVHGWLAKMRGTLIGDEDLRSKGMREMKAAKSEQKRQATMRKHYSHSTGKSMFSFLGFGNSVKSPQHSHHRDHQSKPREIAKLTRPVAQSKPPVRPPLKPSGATPRSSQRSGHRSHHHPNSSKRTPRVESSMTRPSHRRAYFTSQ